MKDGEVVESTAVVVSEVMPPAPMTLFRTDEPAEIVERATRVAASLKDVIDRQKLFTNIQGTKHVRVEGWTLCGSLLGVFPVLEWSRPLADGKGWEARVEARTRDGAVVGAAEAQCTRSERAWANRDDYALRSMAQTRATSKALRQPLGFIVSLAGYDPTPSEDMPHEDSTARPQQRPVAARQRAIEGEVVNSLSPAHESLAQMFRAKGWKQHQVRDFFEECGYERPQDIAVQLRSLADDACAELLGLLQQPEEEVA